LGRFGRHVGRLWHIAEDVSVLVQGHVDELVARALSGRPMLPAVLGIDSQPLLTGLWLSVVQDADEGAAAELVAALPRYGVPEARLVMAREGWAAQKLLQHLPETRYRDALHRLVGRLVRP
jgi:hypothetical protein